MSDSDSDKTAPAQKPAKEEVPAQKSPKSKSAPKKKKPKHNPAEDLFRPPTPPPPPPEEESESTTAESEIEEKRRIREEEEKQARQVFLKSNYTLDEYIRIMHTYKTKDKHERKLRKCIAVCDGDYILKRADTETKYQYHRVLKRDLQTKYLDKTIDLSNGKEYHPVQNSLNRATFYNTLASFRGMELYSSDPRVLSTYVPPSDADYRPDLAQEFIDFMATRVINLPSYYEELCAHAYRFRHPRANIAKFFVHYAMEPNTGKSLLCSACALMYPHFVTPAAQTKLLKSDFNDWMENSLYMYFEELEEGNYREKFFEIFLKQATSENTMIHAKYQKARIGSYKFIMAMNTNAPDLYGLVNADGAVKNRAVIIQFKPAPPQDEWNAFLSHIGMLRAAADYDVTSRRFGASLHRYLAHDWVPPPEFCPDLECWSPDRYDGEDKKLIFEELITQGDKLPIRFIRAMEFMSSEDQTYLSDPKRSAEDKLKYQGDWDHPMRILQRHNTKTYGECVCVLNQSIAHALKMFDKVNQREKEYGPDTITNTLRHTFGWHEWKATLLGVCIERERYEQWKRRDAERTQQQQQQEEPEPEAT